MNKTDYFTKVKKEYFDWLNQSNELLTKILIWAYLIEGRSLSDLQQLNEEKRATKLLETMGKIPFYSELSKKQVRLITKWQKNLYRGDYLLGRALRSVQTTETIAEISTLKEKRYSQKLEQFILNARKLHHLGFYDAAIVMCGKITEYLMKEQLKSESIPYENKWGLSKLFKTFKSKSRKPSAKDMILHNVQEIIRNLRNMFAHGNPEQASEEDSNLVWHSLVFLLNDLALISKKEKDKQQPVKA